MIQCKCGCGGEIISKPHHKYYGIPKYIWGHNSTNVIHSEERKQQQSEKMLGTIRSEESKKKQSNTRKERKISPTNTFGKGKSHPCYGKYGKNSQGWRGGLTTLQKIIRESILYCNWRALIFKRDLYTCKKCERIGGKLNAHHIKELYKIIKDNNIKTFEDAISCEELWDISNGITYCKYCHDLLRNKGGLNG